MHPDYIYLPNHLSFLSCLLPFPHLPTKKNPKKTKSQVVCFVLPMYSLDRPLVSSPTRQGESFSTCNLARSHELWRASKKWATPPMERGGARSSIGLLFLSGVFLPKSLGSLTVRHRKIYCTRQSKMVFFLCRSSYIVQARLKLIILLPQISECENTQCLSPILDWNLVMVTREPSSFNILVSTVRC